MEMTLIDWLGRWLGKLTRWMASAGYFLVSALFHRGYFEYLPSGVATWLETKVRKEPGGPSGQADSDS